MWRVNGRTAPKCNYLPLLARTTRPGHAGNARLGKHCEPQDQGPLKEVFERCLVIIHSDNVDTPRNGTGKFEVNYKSAKLNAILMACRAQSQLSGGHGQLPWMSRLYIQGLFIYRDSHTVLRVTTSDRVNTRNGGWVVLNGFNIVLVWLRRNRRESERCTAISNGALVRYGQCDTWHVMQCMSYHSTE